MYQLENINISSRYGESSFLTILGRLDTLFNPNVDDSLLAAESRKSYGAEAPNM